jgi:hypothetical protein
MGKLDKVTSKNSYLHSSNPILTEYLRFLVRKKIVEDSRNKTGRFTSVFDTGFDLTGILGDEVSDDSDDSQNGRNKTPGLAKTPGISKTQGFYRELSKNTGGKTPGLGSKTPGLGSKTPSLGSVTRRLSIRRLSAVTPGLDGKAPLFRRERLTANSSRNSSTYSRVGMFRKKNENESENDEKDEEISQEYRQILVDYIIGDDSRTGGTTAMSDFEDEVKMILIII